MSTLDLNQLSLSQGRRGQTIEDANEEDDGAMAWTGSPRAESSQRTRPSTQATGNFGRESLENCWVSVAEELHEHLKQLSCDEAESSLKGLNYLSTALSASTLTSLKSCHPIAGIILFSKNN